MNGANNQDKARDVDVFEPWKRDSLKGPEIRELLQGGAQF
jgi:hypothetical protein